MTEHVSEYVTGYMCDGATVCTQQTHLSHSVDLHPISLSVGNYLTLQCIYCIYTACLTAISGIGIYIVIAAQLFLPVLLLDTMLRSV